MRIDRWQISRIGLLAAWLLSPGTVAAQVNPFEKTVDAPGLVIEAIAGWDGTVDQTAPVPISFEMSNFSERAIEGQLTLSDRREGFEVSLGEVYIGPGSKRHLTSIQALTGWDECFATLRDANGVLWRRELLLTTGNLFGNSRNFVLLVDEAGRKLQLSGENSGSTMTAKTTPAMDTVVGPEGRPVRCLTALPWQIPKHPGPLVVIQVMVFPENALANGLNRLQWQAVARWACLGGTVYVHTDSKEIFERLKEFSPLAGGPPARRDDGLVHRMGLGAIHEYSLPLFSAQSRNIRHTIATTTAKLPRSNLNAIVNSAISNTRQRGRADTNRMMVVAFFGIYTLLSGCGALLMFRQSRRRVGTYIVIVVVAASALSALGGVLRFGPGDVEWVTVTQGGVGGLVQVAKLDVQSAGGRTTQVAVSGPDVDLQFNGKSPRYYNSWRGRPQTDYMAFTWQPDFADAVEDVYQVNVPITPWGRRRLQATAFKPDVGRMGFELKFEPIAEPEGDETESDNDGGDYGGGYSNADPATVSVRTPTGVFSVELTNRLPFDVMDGWLVVGVTGSTIRGNSRTVKTVSQPDGSKVSLATSTIDGVDVYQFKQLPSVASGTDYQASFKAQFRPQDAREMIRSWPHILLPTVSGGSVALPRISRKGAATAWIVARLASSPVMNINEQRTDFVPKKQFHLFVQEIDPAEMPAVPFLLSDDDPSGSESSQD